MDKDNIEIIADRTRWGYFTAFALLLIAYFVSFISTQNLVEQSKLANHSNEVIHGLDNIVRYVTQSESAARGYLITNKNELLTKYHESYKNADSALKRLELITAGNPAQVKNLDSLKGLMQKKFDAIEAVFAIFDSTHTITSGILSKRNEAIEKMNRIEDFVHYLQSEEKSLFQERNARLTKYSKTIKAVNIISLIIAIVLTLYSLLTYNRENKAKREASQKAVAYRQQLELRVDELAALNKELIELKNMEKFALTGRISRTIAHEVRNPLTNINLATEQLRNEVPANEEITPLLEMISRNSNRINQLISDLLNATRTSELSYVKTSLNEVIERSLEFAIDRIELKDIRVIKEYDKDICPIVVDKGKIEIALLNIIINSIEAMNKGGVLQVSTRKTDKLCIIKITDNGRGMTKEDIDRLFEPYFTTKAKGAGLGLTNTQNIILAHHGNISVESEPGVGTSFTVTFAIG